jgi:hypothetical protein
MRLLSLRLVALRNVAKQASELSPGVNILEDCGVYGSEFSMTSLPGNPPKSPPGAAPPKINGLHPSWRALTGFCRDLKHGEIERLSIQDGLPILATTTRQKVKFTI